MLDIRRRWGMCVAVLVVGVLGLAACGGDEDDGAAADAATSDEADSDEAASEDASAGESASGGAVTVEHALGTTTIEGRPERVVALGPADLDAALALGADVVGAASTGSGEGVTPWTAAAGGATDLTVLSVSGDALEVDLEEVAALDPDLILAATYYSIDDTYELLSEIAPTTAYQEGPVVDTWQQVTEQVGQALGRSDEAAALVDEVETAIADAAAGDPGVEGKTFTFGFVTPDSVMALRDPDDVMMTVPAGLGMTLSPAVLDLPEGDSFAVPVSLETIDVLDADVLALYDGGNADARSTLEASALYPRLPVVERGAVVDLDDDQFFALRNPTALSIPWLLDTTAPALVEAAQM